MTTNRTNTDWTFLERAHELAEELRRCHGITTMPVPVAAIAAAEGAVVQYVPLMSEGALTRTSSGYVMRVNEAAVPTRRRFTIAHEIAHMLCDRLTETYPGTRYRAGNASIAIQQEERFCQQFASYLLMPDAAIKEFTAWEQMSLVKLRFKAQELQVSTRALLWRVIEQLPYEGGALCFRIMPKPSDPTDMKLRVDWNVFPNTAKKYIARFDAVPQASPIQHCVQHSREVMCQNVKLDFGSLRGRRNLLIKAFGQTVIAIVLPNEVDPAIFQCAFQTVADDM